MFHKTILGTLVVAAGVGAAVLIKNLKNKKEKPEEEDDDNEVHFIKIDDDEEDDLPQYDASGKPAKVQEVCAVYPYLNPDFVEDLLQKNDEFDEKYGSLDTVNVTHRLKFGDKETRERFAEIMDASGYVNVQLSDVEMTSTRKFYVEEGAIISDILNVANQAAALKGTYEGYDIFE